MKFRLSRERLRIGTELARRDPLFLVKTATRIGNRSCHRHGHWNFNRAGVNVFERDWDNLVLLDACRHEMLEDHPFEGRYDTVTSRGSDTYEFLQANCGDSDLSDTVYVSASPVLAWHADTIDQNFHDVVFVWEERGWDETERTVMPGDVRDIALRTADEYPDKRLLVHFLQPHYPFIGSDTVWDKQQLHRTDRSVPSFWRRIETGSLDVSPERLWELYERNLAVALPYAEELVDRLEGKTVVTSDHGNMFGERSSPLPMREWGHPPGIYTDQLVTVPWIECAFDRRRELTHGGGVRTPISNEGEEREEIRERMIDLGYIG